MGRKAYSKYEKLAGKIFDFVGSRKEKYTYREAIASLELCKLWMQMGMLEDETNEDDADEDEGLQINKNTLSLTLDVKTLEPEINDSLCS